jgi:hypothetical protein
MLGFIKRKVQQRATATALRELQDQRRFLDEATPAEASVVLVSTALAAKFLRATPRTSLPFPEPYLQGVAVASEGEQRGQLSDYAVELMALHEAAAASSSPANELMATGMAVLINSVRAVAHGPTTLAEGRKLWRELMRGLPGYAETYRKLLGWAPDEALEQDLFVPAMLVPEWPAVHALNALNAAGDAVRRASSPRLVE